MAHLLGPSLLSRLPRVVERGIVRLTEDVLAEGIEAVEDVVPVIDAGGVAFGGDDPAADFFLWFLG